MTITTVTPRHPEHVRPGWRPPEAAAEPAGDRKPHVDHSGYWCRLGWCLDEDWCPHLIADEIAARPPGRHTDMLIDRIAASSTTA